MRPRDARRRRLGADGGAAPDHNLIEFLGNLVRTAGSVLLNAAGRANPAELATIAAHDDISIEAGGDFTMGVNEKMTGLGDVTIASGGTTSVSDTNAAGNLTVLGPVIEIVRRAGGTVRTPSGSVRMRWKKVPK